MYQIILTTGIANKMKIYSARRIWEATIEKERIQRRKEVRGEVSELIFG